LAGDLQPERLTEHLLRYRAAHPYADPLVTTLINPDRGDFFAAAVQRLLERPNGRAEDIDGLDALPTFRVAAYVEDQRLTTVRSLAKLRQLQADDPGAGAADHFRPGLESTIRDLSELSDTPPPEANIAIVSDFTRPGVVSARLDGGEAA